MDEKSTPSQPTRKILRTEFGLMVSLDDAAQTITLSDALGVNLMTVKVAQGTIEIRSAVRIVLEAPIIQHGQGASHPAVFGDQLLTYLNQLVSMFNTHIHPGELAAGFIPVTPAPPVPFVPAGDAEPHLDEELHGLGTMADELTAGGTVFAPGENSMAAAIERQLNDLLDDAGLDRLPTDNTREARDRRRMFAAIARGVIEHLAANPTALRIVMTSAPHDEDDYVGHVAIDWTELP